VRRLKAFARLPSADRWLLVEAAGAVVVIKAALRLLSLRRVRAAVALVGGTHEVANDRRTPDRVASVVKRACDVVPGKYTCLVRALAAQLLLQRRGLPSRLEIGFLKSSGGTLEGHAWLGCGERVIIGNDLDLTTFTRLESTDL
jgi:Transglutaminase-like superfamily